MFGFSIWLNAFFTVTATQTITFPKGVCPDPFTEKAAFLVACNAIVSPFGVTCTDVQCGSIIVILGGQSHDDVAKAIEHIIANGLAISGFGTLRVAGTFNIGRTGRHSQDFGTMGMGTMSFPNILRNYKR